MGAQLGWPDTMPSPKSLRRWKLFGHVFMTGKRRTKGTPPSRTGNSYRPKDGSALNLLFQSFQLLFEEEKATMYPIRAETHLIDSKGFKSKISSQCPWSRVCGAMKRAFCKWPALEL